jgi:hypothetical protein
VLVYVIESKGDERKEEEVSEVKGNGEQENMEKNDAAVAAKRRTHLYIPG